MSAGLLAELDWLVGEWEADPDPQGVTGGSRFALEAGGNALVRTNWADYPPMDGKPASRHDDVMVVHEEGTALAALYIDSEGHVIRYDGAMGPGRVAFTSRDAPGPRFRLTYTRATDGSAAVDFEVAPPGRDFARYVGGTIRRKA